MTTTLPDMSDDDLKLLIAALRWMHVTARSHVTDAGTLGMSADQIEHHTQVANRCRILIERISTSTSCRWCGGTGMMHVQPPHECIRCGGTGVSRS